MKQELKNSAYPSPNGMSNGGSYQEGRYQANSSPYPPTKNESRSNSFSHKAPSLASDLHCYFQCAETFKKDYDLRLHLKLRHKNENPNELRRAEQAAEEEISFVSRSGSKFQCAICSKTYDSDSTMGDHTKKAHGMPWMEYQQKYGRCEIESAPFECKVCGSVV